jgi:hypothetical protein
MRTETGAGAGGAILVYKGNIVDMRGREIERMRNVKRKRKRR